MEIGKLIILGAGTKIQELFSKRGVKVIVVGEADYAEELPDADMILENLPGNVELKKELFRNCDRKAPQKTIFATTAESGITEIAAATQRPEKFIGLNFTLNPSTEKYLVQITKGLETSEETVYVCLELVERVGAVGVELKETSGLILNRVLASTINQAAIMHDTGLASTEDIDKAMKLCANWPVGPFELADSIGVDKVVATLELLSQQLGPQYIPSILLRKMVAAGRLGKKTGKGFYTYS